MQPGPPVECQSRWDLGKAGRRGDAGKGDRPTGERRGDAGPDPTGDEVRALWRSGRREASYALVVRSTQDSLFRFLRSMLRREEETREAFQETYLRVFRGLGGFRGAASLNTWVLRIGRNVALNRIRREKGRAGRMTALDDPRTPVREPSVEAGNGSAELDLAAAVDALSPAQREAVRLFYVEGLAVQEVAAVTGRPSGTVKSDLLRARRRLRRLLES